MAGVYTTDVIGNIATNAEDQKKLAFRWFVDCNFFGDTVEAVVKFHAERANDSRAGGESPFVFSEEEVLGIVNDEDVEVAYGLVNCIRLAAERRDELNDELKTMAKEAITYLPSKTDADNVLVEKFTNYTSYRKMDEFGVYQTHHIPKNDGFINRLRLVALHEAYIAFMNHKYVGFGIARY